MEVALLVFFIQMVVGLGLGQEITANLGWGRLDLTIIRLHSETISQSFLRIRQKKITALCSEKQSLSAMSQCRSAECRFGLHWQGGFGRCRSSIHFRPVSFKTLYQIYHVVELHWLYEIGISSQIVGFIDIRLQI